jgi:hypothetical protein
VGDIFRDQAALLAAHRMPFYPERLSGRFQEIRRRMKSIISTAIALAMILSLHAATPILEFQMDAGSGTTVVNTGSAGGSASILGAKPTWTSQVPVHGGAYALDFGAGPNVDYVVQMNSPNALKNLKSFTLTGWLNCRNSTTGAGGNRILTWLAIGGGHGVDLSYQNDGSLQLGVNEWNDYASIRSNGGKITADANASFNNWRFFAVTYNSTVPNGQVKFYFGSNGGISDLDCIRDYARGSVGANISPTVAIGHHDGENRPYGTDQMFRGLIDQIRVYGSTADGSGALTASEIAQIQNASPLTGQGVLYEEWTGVGGASIEDLVSSPNFPSNPSATLVRPSFDGFQNRADNFGVRMSAWVKAPETGAYTFWIASDDNSELRLSTDANPANKILIASVSGYTGYLEWGRYPSQQSEPITLAAGQFYYIEALFKEGGGNDHIEVGWRLPSGAYEKPIPAGRLYLRPDEGDGLFPSTVNLYEPGTSNIKATLGWHKESGLNHLYLSTENMPKFLIHNDVVNLPAKKLFFGENGEQNDLGFRYDQPAGGGASTLYLETDVGNWGLKINGGGFVPYPPYAEFNQRLWVTGPENPGENIFARLEYRNGLIFENDQDFGPSNHSFKASTFNGEGLTLSEAVADANGLETSSTTVYAGTAEFSTSTNDPNDPVSTTSIQGGTLTADEVVTRKWKVPPADYVFEKGYTQRSLEDVERYVRKHKHLPEMPSAKEMEDEGLSVGDMNLRLLKTVEEMTLNLIEMKKELKAQKARNDALAKDIRALRTRKKEK